MESPEQYEWFIKMNNGDRDCFASHNSYPEHGKLINTFIPQDFDSKEKPENALLDALRLKPVMDKLGVPTAAMFSGSKGFHFYSVFLPELINDNQALKTAYSAFQNNQVAEAKLRTYDKHIIGDTRRILRIPNTIHPKTKLYCVQVPWDMMERASMPEILEWAKQPRPVELPEGRETFSEHFRRVGYKRDRIAVADSGEPEPTVPYHYDLVPELVKALIPRPCIHQSLMSHNPPHHVRVEAASTIARKGFPFGVYSDVMNDIGELAKWVDRHNKDRMTYQLKHIYTKGYEHQMSCEKVRSYGLCVGSSCARFATEFPEEYARELSESSKSDKEVEGDA